MDAVELVLVGGGGDDAQRGGGEVGLDRFAVLEEAGEDLACLALDVGVVAGGAQQVEQHPAQLADPALLPFGHRPTRSTAGVASARTRALQALERFAMERRASAS